MREKTRKPKKPEELEKAEVEEAKEAPREEAEEHEEVEVPEELKEPEEPKKKKAEKKKKKEKGIFSYYKIEEKELVRLRPFCERCGPGYFMADHGDRYTCGHCGFTRYKRTETSK